MSSRILRLPAAQEYSGLKRSTIYLRIEQGLFPQPIPLGPSGDKKSAIVGWPERELSAINEARIRGAGDEEIRGLVKNLVAERKSAVAKAAA